jgi:hypothetical protein
MDGVGGKEGDGWIGWELGWVLGRSLERSRSWGDGHEFEDFWKEFSNAYRKLEYLVRAMWKVEEIERTRLNRQSLSNAV